MCRSYGAFFGKAELQAQTIADLDKLVDRMFIQKKWREDVRRTTFLDFLAGRYGTLEDCGCLFYHLTGQRDVNKGVHEARRQFNFPTDFSWVLMRAYDYSIDDPGPLAREMIRAIVPGTNLYQVVRQFEGGRHKEKHWPLLKSVLTQNAPYLAQAA